MLKGFYCQAVLILELIPQGALLVKAGEPDKKRKPETWTFFRAWNPQKGREEPCIPASSLKGAIRSYAEAILRSFDPKDACDPFADEGRSGMHPSCSARMNDLRQGKKIAACASIYKELCPACKLFGCTHQMGRLTVEDAFPANQIAQGSYQTQTSIAIDRFTGGAKGGALYRREPITDPQIRFPTRLTLINFELWQLGLIGLVLRDLNEKLNGVGSGRRAAYGEVSVTLQRLEVSYRSLGFDRIRSRAIAELEEKGREKPSPEEIVLGICSLMPEELAKFHGLPLEFPLRVPRGQAVEGGPLTFGLAWEGGEDIQGVFAACVEKSLALRLSNGF